MECKCLCYNKNYQHKFEEKLKKQSFNTYKFFNRSNNKKFILLSQKGVYLYEYMDDWEEFNDISLPENEDFYSHLNMEDITDADYALEKRVFNDFEIKNLGEYHDLYVQSDTLLLDGLFQIFRNLCLEIYELDPAQILPAPGLACQAVLKKTKVKSDLLTYIDMLLMVQKGIREYFTLFFDMQKLITNT